MAAGSVASARERAPQRCCALIVTAAMGSGHVRVSQELGRRLKERGHQVVTADFNDLLPSPAGRFLRWLYPWLVNHAPGLYDVIYQRFFLAQQRAGGRVQPAVLLAMRRLRSLVEQVRPDVVVSTYHLAALAVGRLRAQGSLCCPAISFVTTFSVHNLWIHPATDVELCITEAAARDTARRSGRPARVCGPVVDQAFRQPRHDPAHRTMPLPGGSRAALVATGSLGLGAVERAVTAIAAEPGWTPVVLCGRNEQLKQRLQRLGGVVALGWVEDMPQLMAASDALVENAGGLTAKEALCCGLPVLTYQPIAGHGRDDAAALARLGLTEVCDDEPTLLAALRRLAADRSLRDDRIARGRALFRGDAATSVERVALRHRDGRRQDSHPDPVVRTPAAAELAS